MSEKANQGLTQGYLANPGPEEGGGASGFCHMLGKGLLDPASKLMSRAGVEPEERKPVLVNGKR